MGTVPAGYDLICTVFDTLVDSTTGTFTPNSTDITVLLGIGSGASDLLFTFWNNNVHTANMVGAYSFFALGNGYKQVPAGSNIYCQFNNAGITGGGTAAGRTVLSGVLVAH
jgi:hypothetical protein